MITARTLDGREVEAKGLVLYQDDNPVAVFVERNPGTVRASVAGDQDFQDLLSQIGEDGVKASRYKLTPQEQQ